MKTRPVKVYELGSYKLDLGTCKLWRGSEEIRLRPKLLDLLVVLLDHNGQMVEKDELIKQLWPNSVVEENNLTVTVNALRSLLGEGYIETVSKRGYRFAREIKVVNRETASPTKPRSLPDHRDPPGGAIPLHSDLYIVRAQDEEFCGATARGDSIVLIKGARQVGKTSLLARGLQEARTSGAITVLTDFQQFNSALFESADTLLRVVAEQIAHQLDIENACESWKSFLGANTNFERFIKLEVLGRTESRIVWGMDEVDRLFGYGYAGEIFGLFRSWHNSRALEPNGPWQRLTLAIAYATEAHLFIRDLNQSPFNVGTRLQLGDFTLEQVIELNRRYGEPLRDLNEAKQIQELLGGHPYLTQRCLHEMAKTGMSLDAIEEQAEQDEGIFGDHLQRMLIALNRDPSLVEELKAFLMSASQLTAAAVSRLRAAGLLSSESESGPQIRCGLYLNYLRRRLL